MVYPFLNTTLHAYFLQPVHIFGGGSCVGRAGHQRSQFFGAVRLVRVETLRLHPHLELFVEDDEFLPFFAVFVHKIVRLSLFVGIDFATALVHQHKGRLYAGRGLRHKAGGAGRRNGKAGDVAASVLGYGLTQLLADTQQTVQERILLLFFGIVDGEGSAFAGQLSRRQIG